MAPIAFSRVRCLLENYLRSDERHRPRTLPRERWSAPPTGVRAPGFPRQRRAQEVRPVEWAGAATRRRQRTSPLPSCITPVTTTIARRERLANRTPCAVDSKLQVSINVACPRGLTNAVGVYQCEIRTWILEPGFLHRPSPSLTGIPGPLTDCVWPLQQDTKNSYSRSENKTNQNKFLMVRIQLMTPNLTTNLNVWGGAQEKIDSTAVNFSYFFGNSNQKVLCCDQNLYPSV
ncbi:uncharacterized protein LOC126424575 [Schistocerca serialis cubense]|uniref:uncharacterized protein LOC126424575 n=1 Tax=Schistocerca serialis cubense TaxID=2023355 RepID=UPI00214E26F5|nr:uncharacterized protein LOC126424575 [Schistocerca serialis cubense]